MPAAKTPCVTIRRLAADRRGNVMAITALSLIPLLAMAGSALDMSRAYLIKSRLQQSCDAAVLAGRRKMGAGAWDSPARAAADRYFKSNFPDGSYASSNSQIAYTANTTTVSGVASATLPMAIMQLFGIEQMTLGASCDARLELPNADIMFVLDTTYSMTETNTGDTQNKLTGLQGAVPRFYDALEAAKGVGTRIRYGFVPYSTTVNVGTLLKPDWIADRATYQSRVLHHVEQVKQTQGPTYIATSDWRYVSGAKVDSSYTVRPEQCSAPSNTISSNVQNGPWTDNGNGTRSFIQTVVYNGKGYNAYLSPGTCRIDVVDHRDYKEERTVTEYPNPNAGAVSYYPRYWWSYQPVEYNLAPLKAIDGSGNVVGGTLATMIGDDQHPRNAVWNQANACIEERQTSAATTAQSPGTAFDLDVDTKPTAGVPATQWRPMLNPLVYARRGGEKPNDTYNWLPPTQSEVTYGNYYYYSLAGADRDIGACPTYARKLSSITRSDLVSYMSVLKPGGGTYHDIGMLWGLRLLSAQGIFQDDNVPPTPGALVARHLIFMTDGQTDTNIADYDAYGVSALDRRRTPASRLPTKSEQNTLVETRLAGLCAVAKAKGITVWMIAFGTTLNSTFTACASEGHSFQANDTAQLNLAFSNIASQIAQLRLTR